MNLFETRAFIFDMDGTLVDNMRFHTEAWGKMLLENGVEMNAHDFLVKTAGKTNREILPGVFGEISDAKILELGERKETLYRELFLPERRAVEGVLEFLEESQRLGIKMAVATAAPVGNMEFILDGLDLRRFFDAITTADDIANGKPDPEIFLKSAERLGVEPQNCLVFEDAPKGVEAALHAGMDCIVITTLHTQEELSGYENVVGFIGDYTEDLLKRF